MSCKRFDFDTVIPREGTSSLKWDARPGVMPLWVADMDFQAAPCILESIKKKLDHGIFGYTLVPDSYFEATASWLSRRHSWNIAKDWILPIGGLVPAASVALKALTKPGDEVIFHTPAYNCFFNNVKDTGCVTSESKLIYKDGKYTIDFEDFENRCRSAKVFLLCNPQNPTGRLWTRQELEKLGDICLKYGVKVISDEIHCDIVPPGSAYTPFCGIKPEFEDNAVCFNSPTKCFNIAGLHVSNIIVKNAAMRENIHRVMTDWVHCDMNQIGVAALQGAFSAEGEEWLDQMNSYIHENFLYLRDRFAKELPQIPVCDLEATYLVWADCSALPVSTQVLQDYLIANQKVWINSGAMYGDDKFVRINIACPRATLSEAVDRIVAGIRQVAGLR